MTFVVFDFWCTLQPVVQPILGMSAHVQGVHLENETAGFSGPSIFGRDVFGSCILKIKQHHNSRNIGVVVRSIKDDKMSTKK